MKLGAVSSIQLEDSCTSFETCSKYNTTLGTGVSPTPFPQNLRLVFFARFGYNRKQNF